MKTVSQKLAEQLYIARFPQESYFWWMKPLPGTMHYRGHGWEFGEKQDWGTVNLEHYFAAPAAEEILDRLPFIIADTWTFVIKKGPAVGTWTVGYEDEEQYMSKEMRWFSNNLAEAAGNLWLHLKKNNII